jgi:hypothetical protein
MRMGSPGPAQVRPLFLTSLGEVVDRRHLVYQFSLSPLIGGVKVSLTVPTPDRK